MKGEYILVSWSNAFGWCLECVCGNCDIKHLEKIMTQKEKDFPEKEFKFEFLPDEDCWWNKGELDQFAIFFGFFSYVLRTKKK